METRHNLYRLLGQLLEYPDGELPGRSRQCRSLLTSLHPEAAAAMEGFIAFVEGTSQGRMEEIYTATFDLSPLCSPYIGFQLFGEDDPKRADLMVRLQDSYQLSGFSSGNEMPDHVAVLLSFLASLEDEELACDLRSELLVPALMTMADSLEEKNAYRGVLLSAALICAGPGSTLDALAERVNRNRRNSERSGPSAGSSGSPESLNVPGCPAEFLSRRR